MNYVEFVDPFGNRMAFSTCGVFVLKEIGSKFKVTVTSPEKGQKPTVIDNGCVVWVPGYPSMVIKDTYEEALGKLENMKGMSGHLAEFKDI